MRSLLSVDSFKVVLEEDGSCVPDDVLESIIDENEKVGTLMILQPGEIWTACM